MSINQRPGSILAAAYTELVSGIIGSVLMFVLILEGRYRFLNVALEATTHATTGIALMMLLRFLLPGGALVLGITGFIGAILLKSNKKAVFTVSYIWIFGNFFLIVLGFFNILLSALLMRSTYWGEFPTLIIIIFSQSIPGIIVLFLLNTKRVKEFKAG